MPGFNFNKIFKFSSGLALGACLLSSVASARNLTPLISCTTRWLKTATAARTPVSAMHPAHGVLTPKDIANQVLTPTEAEIRLRSIAFQKAHPHLTTQELYQQFDVSSLLPLVKTMRDELASALEAKTLITSDAQALALEFIGKSDAQLESGRLSYLDLIHDSLSYAKAANDGRNFESSFKNRDGSTEILSTAQETEKQIEQMIAAFSNLPPSQAFDYLLIPSFDSKSIHDLDQASVVDVFYLGLLRPGQSVVADGRRHFPLAFLGHDYFHASAAANLAGKGKSPNASPFTGSRYWNEKWNFLQAFNQLVLAQKDPATREILGVMRFFLGHEKGFPLLGREMKRLADLRLVDDDFLGSNFMPHLLDRNDLGASLSETTFNGIVANPSQRYPFCKFPPFTEAFYLFGKFLRSSKKSALPAQ